MYASVSFCLDFLSLSVRLRRRQYSRSIQFIDKFIRNGKLETLIARQQDSNNNNLVST